METLWDYIKDIYSRKFNIPPLITDFIAVERIVYKSASGYSNRRISFAINESMEYIRQVLEDFIGFSGWDNDLDFNPLALYNRNKDNYDEYMREVSMISSITSDFYTSLTYKVCERYTKMKERIKEYYD